MVGNHTILKRTMIAIALMALAALGVGLVGGIEALRGRGAEASNHSGQIQVAAQNQPPQTAPASQPASPPPAQATSPQQATIPRFVIVRLVRSALVALGQANDTGNYTVLRSLATPDFQQKNSAEDLARIFVSTRGIDVGAAAVVEPVIASVDSDGQEGLIIKGSLPLQPNAANFVVIYRPVNKIWRLFGLSVANAAPQPAQAQPQQPVQ